MDTQVAPDVGLRQPKRFLVIYPWEIAGKLWWLLIRKLSCLKQSLCSKLDALTSFDMAIIKAVR